MGQSQVETCQIRLIWSRPKSLKRAMMALSGKELCCWVAERVTNAGNVVIAESEEFVLPLRESDLSAAWEDRATITTEARLFRQQLFQKLQSDGWEFVMGGPDDRVMTLKRGKTPSPSLGDSDPTELLKKLASLRDAGIITSDEFDRKKAEILKRL